MKPATQFLKSTAWLAGLAIVQLAAGEDLTISSFANFKPDAVYDHWVSAPSASSSTNFQITASGYGSGYKAITPILDASGATTIELTVTIDGPPGVLGGPIVSLVDEDGTFVDFAWYGQTAGPHVLTAELGKGVVRQAGKTPGLDLSHLAFFHLQNDPGGYAGQYTISFEKLRLLRPDRPVIASGPVVTKPVLVHYMPWFQAKGDYSSQWGYHWTMNQADPEVKDGAGKRQIASHYYPLIGPYDSLDPAVLEYHVLLMKLAGIDGVIVDWYGPDDTFDFGINNQRTLALLNYIRKAGLKFALCFEDATIKREIEAGYEGINASNAIAHAQQTMLYAQTHFLTDPSYLRLNQAPVFLNFGPQYFHLDSDWDAIFSPLDATNRPAFFTEDNRLANGTGAFDWPPMWLTSSAAPELLPVKLETYLAGFDEKAGGWSGFVSSAFPRFHDFYGQSGGHSYGYLDDASGGTLAGTLSRALTNHSALVQIATWNDFGEGTVVEPTQEYGYRDLGIIQDLRRRYCDPGFACQIKDLSLARRFYALRKRFGANPSVAAELDRAFDNLVSGKVSVAGSQLTDIETKMDP